MSIYMIFCKNVSSLAFGVNIVLNLFSSCNNYGCWLKKQMASASKMTKHPSGRFLTNIGKNCDIYLSLPNPGPIIQE